MIDPSKPFSQIARGVSVHYTATFLIVVVFAVGLFCLMLAASVLAMLRLVLMGLGIMCILAGLVAFAYLIFWRPELLRSENHLQFMKMADWLADPDLDEETSNRIEKVLPLFLGRRGSKMRRLDDSGDSSEDDS